jgi:ribosomal protein S18 acetylase RimI-like enzyme
MIAETVQEYGEFRGLRRLQGGRDLREVADLIEEAFAGEMDDAGRAALRELRLMSYWGAALLFSNLGYSQRLAPFSGFVWVEDGRIVGNITLQPSDVKPGRWLISNVAVKRRYRGRGIARALMVAAIDEARHRGGQAVGLQVRADNTPAIYLYRGLGFKKITTTYHLKLRQVGPVEPVVLPGVLLRPLRADEGQRIRELACAATSPGQRWESTIRERDYGLSFPRRLVEALDKLLGGPAYHRLVAEAQGRLAGFIVVQRARWHGCHHLKMYVHPDYRGRLEEVLVSHGLALLRQAPNRPIFLKYPASHVEGEAPFKAYGFQEMRTLVWMTLNLTS